MQISQIISYWNNLDFESRKYVIRMVHENIDDNNLISLSNMTYQQLENAGYRKLIIQAVEEDINRN